MRDNKDAINSIKLRGEVGSLSKKIEKIINLHKNNLQYEMHSNENIKRDLSDKYINEQKDSIKNEIIKALEEFVREQGLNIKLVYNPNDKEHPFSIENNVEAHDNIKEKLTKKINKHSKELEDYKKSNHPSFSKNEKELEGKLQAEKGQLKILESLDKVIDHDKIKSVEEELNKKFKKLDKEIDKSVEDFIKEVREKGGDYNSKNKSKANIIKAVGGVLTALAGIAAIGIGVALSVGTLGATAPIAGILTAIYGSIGLGAIGGVITGLWSSFVERGNRNIERGIIDKASNDLMKIPNTLEEVGKILIENSKPKEHENHKHKLGSLSSPTVPDHSEKANVKSRK